MRTKTIVWVCPILIVAAALIRSIMAADQEPVQVAQVPSLFDEPAEVYREPLAPDAPDPDTYEPRSRHVQRMYDLIDGMHGSTVEGQSIDDEQRRYLRQELMLVDDELADSMGGHLEHAILRANNPRSTFIVGAPPQDQLPPRRRTLEYLHRIRLPKAEDGKSKKPAAAAPTPATPAVEPETTPPPVADPFGN